MASRCGWMLAAAVLLAGCGAGIGDACSKDQDCGGRTCDTQFAFPGGYCTQHCTVGDASTCPGGSACQAHHGVIECLRECEQDLECRSGYVCHGFRNDSQKFCLDPDDD